MNNIPCRYFSTPSGCRFGVSCRYYHDNTASNQSSNTSYTSSSYQTSSYQSSSYQPPSYQSSSYKSSSYQCPQVPKAPKAPCRFHSSPGGCRYGAKCYYKHEGPGGGIQKDENKDNKPKKVEEKPKADKKDELTVFGYIRNLQKCIKNDDSIFSLMEIDSIPRELMSLCCDFYSIITKWDDNKAFYNSLNQAIVDSGNCIKQTKTGWGSAFLTEQIDSNLHHFKFKIESLDSRRKYYVLFGCWKVESGKPLLDTFFTDKKNNGYAINVIDGTLTDPKIPGCGGIRYATYCKTGDIVDMFIDLRDDEKSTLTFAINGKYYQDGAKIEKCKYKIAITMYWEGDKIRLLSHDNNPPNSS